MMLTAVIFVQTSASPFLSEEAMTKPTPKERVLKRWPDAWRKPSAIDDGWHSIYRWVAPHIDQEIGTGPTPAAAWRDAAERMK